MTYALTAPDSGGQVFVIQTLDDGTTKTIPQDPGNADYQAYLSWVAHNGQPETLPEPVVDPSMEMMDTLREAAADALEANRLAGQQNAAIIAAAKAMESFAGTTLTQAQTIKALKDLATGVRILAEHDQQGLAQRNVLIRLAVGDLSGTD